MASAALQEIAKSLPTRPGIYLFKDGQGAVLYVGKAANLRNRVRSYFQAPDGFSLKIPHLLARAQDLDVIVTSTEAEALILENTFIKRHKPRFNVRLKDDKTYPYLKIDAKEDFPRVYITRRMEQDGARYFGPYASALSIRKTLDLLNKLFPYRSCTKVITGTDPRPCLDYYIHRCLGPCTGAINREEYHAVINEVILFLDGRHDVVVRDIKGKMAEAAKALQYERAGFYRDQLRAIEKAVMEQRAVSTRLVNEDAIAVARVGNEAWVEVFFIRGGKLVGRDNFILEGTEDEEDGEVLASFVKQFYSSTPYVPPTLLLQHPLTDAEAIRTWLSEKREGPVALLVPQRGDKRKLVEMVAENAQQGFEVLRVKVLAAEDATQQALETLKEELNLPALPARMECYDISNTQGTNSVASMVVFESGQPRKAHYRKFHIKSVEGPNDFASMQEVLRRRFRRATATFQGESAKGEDLRGARPSGSLSSASRQGEPLPPGREAGREGSKGVHPLGGLPSEVSSSERGDAFGILPDLVVIDGGKGQLNAALEVMRMELGLHRIPVIGLAKQQEEVFVPDMPESIMLPRTSPALYLLQRIRDEAHRFAITFHRGQRQKRGMESALDIVPGIGPKRKRMLLRQFGSVQKIREASLDDLAAVPGMTHKLAAKVKEYI